MVSSPHPPEHVTSSSRRAADTTGPKTNSNSPICLTVIHRESTVLQVPQDEQIINHCILHRLRATRRGLSTMPNTTSLLC